MNKKINIFIYMTLIISIAIVEVFHLDLKISEYLYQLQGGRAWRLQNAFITRTVIHNGGRWLVIAVFLFVLSILTFKAWNRQDTLPYIYLVVSVATSMVIINILKHTTHMDCPDHLLQFGGQYKYVSLFEFRPKGWAYRGVCFPAGHASGAYAWISLFFFSLLQGKKRYSFLIVPFVIGLIFDWSQQLRGEHFFSHGLFDLLIIWSVSNLFYAWFSLSIVRSAFGRRPSK